jgi:hypothetical protein
MTQQVWKNETGKVFYGVLTYTVLSMLYSVLSMVAMAQSLFGGTPWYMYLMPILIVGGYVFYFLGINNLAKELTGEDQNSFMKIRTAIILSIVGMLCAMIPLAGKFIAAILNIVAIVFYLKAYSALRDSSTFPEMARKGAGLLRTSMIINIISIVIGIIPIVGYIGKVLDIAVLILIIVGWSKVKNADVA